jgi:hypothetical protein
MIHIFQVDAPLGDLDPDATTAKLTTQLARVADLYPALRSAAVAASEGVLTMTLRVSARDRWATSRAARLVASSMLRRAKISVSAASMTIVATPSNGRSLTGATGRSAAPRIPARWDLDLDPAPAEPH